MWQCGASRGSLAADANTLILPFMILPSSPETPAPRRRRWGWIVLAIFLALSGAVSWRLFTEQCAIRQLDEAGVSYKEMTLWDKAGRDWHGLLRPRIWEEFHQGASFTHLKASPVRKITKSHNLDAIAPALRRLNPNSIDFMSSPGCPALENLDALRGLTSLRALEIGYCTSLRNLDGLKGLPQLKHLVFLGCSALPNLDGLQGLTKLESIQLDECTALQNLDGLKGLANLKYLRLNGCSSLENVDAIKALTQLRDVTIYGRRKLSAEAIATLKAAIPNTQISTN